MIAPPTGKSRVGRKCKPNSVGYARIAILSGLVAAALIFFAYLIFSDNEEASGRQERAVSSKRLITEVLPSKPPSLDSQMEAVDGAKERKAPSPQVVARRDRRRAMSNDEKKKELMDYLQSKPIDLTPTTNRPFRTGIELSMARIFTTELGDPPPPDFSMLVPIQDEAHLAEIILAGNPAIEGDSEAVKDAKKTVEAAKEELRKYIKEGGDASSFMQYYYGLLVQANQERQLAHKEVMNLIKSDPDIAEEFYYKVNERLAGKGIKPVHISSKLKERLKWEH